MTADPSPTLGRDGPFPSPCRKICVLHGNSFCVGCGRKLDEIVRWASMTAEEREAILSRVSRYRPPAPYR